MSKKRGKKSQGLSRKRLAEKKGAMAGHIAKR